MAAKPPQILDLTPSNEIVFEGPFEQVVTSYLEIKNPSQQKVCFKVKTTAPRRYCVRPNSGVIEPGSKLKIAIMLQPIEQDSQSERSKHKFMVQSTIIRDEYSKLEELWSKVSPEDIMDSKLRCVFQLPNQARVEASSQQQAASDTTSSSTLDLIQTSKQQPSMKKLPQTAGDGQNTSRAKESETTIRASASENLQPANSSRSAWDKGNISSQNLSSKKSSLDADKSIASSHNLTSSFLQPMSDDYKMILVSLAMLVIGVILGKYII